MPDNQPKWTPGPWRNIGIDEFLQIHKGGIIGGAILGDGQVIAQIFVNNHDLRKAEATGALFAAAPELYDALEAMLQEPWTSRVEHPERDRAIKALARANPAKWGPGASTNPDAGTDTATGSKEKDRG